MGFARAPESIECAAGLDRWLETAPAGAAVFAIHVSSGAPYLGRTAVLRRRLNRLLRQRAEPSRALNLRELSERIEYWPVASRLESSLILYELARRYLPDRYVEFLKLRMPPYVKLTLGNEFPRTQITSRLSGGMGQYYGPFRSRASAEEFEHALLDLFQIRRCQEDLAPAPDHPGCIYGEMGMCLRPCQQVVGVEEYASEAARVSEFLRTNGASALHTAEALRDRMSTELEFEEAARQHKRLERMQALLKLRDELAGDATGLCGVAVTPSANTGAVSLWFLQKGAWQAGVEFDIGNSDGQVSMDVRLREIVASLPTVPATNRERQEHLAILARWFYSSWCDGKWIRFESIDKLPYRRVVAAISRAVHESAPRASD